MAAHEIDDIVFVSGSDNTFADLGLPNADELLVKSKLVMLIGHIIRERGLTSAHFDTDVSARDAIERRLEELCDKQTRFSQQFSMLTWKW